ncbi:hypothetical protein [Rickettsia endosymbiont of Oedothorax gibbosus]|uniref:hypothetical protein n=1 Tax=Rickettsia endosymbiont of Oedothorax gibbosus TaxID=931099 RepID=UPI002025A976|nr:hypothetical protein [Rickettsia endosymbiont of Oedothorax gibbosus]
MIAILSAFMGFFSSFIPEILHFLKDKKDKEHELKLIDLQLKALKTGHSARLEEIQIKADNDESKYLYQYAGMQIASNSNNGNWFDFLATSVRPMITYIFFLLYVALKLAIFIKFGGSVDTLWSSEDQGIFCAVIGFWFGHRAFGRYRVNGNNNGHTYSNGNGYPYINGSSNGKVNGYKY